MTPEQEAELNRLIMIQAIADPRWLVLDPDDECHYDDRLCWYSYDKESCEALASSEFPFEVVDFGYDPFASVWDGMQIKTNYANLLRFLLRGT